MNTDDAVFGWCEDLTRQAAQIQFRLIGTSNEDRNEVWDKSGTDPLQAFGNLMFSYRLAEPIEV